MTINKKVAWLLLMVGSSLTAFAQFNPSNPPDPVMYFKLTTTCDPSNAGYTSGDGQYMEGQTAWVSTSSNTNYTFRYWTLNGVKYSEEQSFQYTMGSGKTVFVAHYDFAPSNPEEPALKLMNRLYLKCTPEGCCSFNRTNGEKCYPDNYVYVDAYVNQGYEFLGWYEGNKLVSEYQGFNYYMTGSNNVTLEARFKFNPANPSDPSSSGNEPTYMVGDVDRDGIVDVTDAVIVNNHYINGTVHELKNPIADANKDATIDISDVVEILQKYLNLK